MYSYSTTGILETQFEPGDRIEVALDDDSRGLVLPAEFRAGRSRSSRWKIPRGGRSNSARIPSPASWSCPISQPSCPRTGIACGWSTATRAGFVWLSRKRRGRRRKRKSSRPSKACRFSPIRRTGPWCGANLGGSGLSSATLPEVELALRAGPALDPCGLRSAHLLAAGPRHGDAGASGPHRQDRAAAVSRPGPAVRRGGPGQDHRGGPGARRTAHCAGWPAPCLVLVPPSLIEQWQGEMRRKFVLEFISHDDPAFRDTGQEAWTKFDRVIVSMHTAKREPHRSAIARPQVGHDRRRRGPSPAQSQHPGLAVRQ